jgi:DNA-binding response OmpR family regulator
MAKILVVDDDDAHRRMVGLALTRALHEVIEAKDGVEGLRRFDDEKPDLVVCDIVMPEKEGIQTIVEMRAASAKVAIIAISGGGIDIGLNYLDHARKLGADAILSKPFRPVELVDLVEHLLIKYAS